VYRQGVGKLGNPTALEAVDREFKSRHPDKWTYSSAVELSTDNRTVTGSNPVASTIIIKEGNACQVHYPLSRSRRINGH
jgi:hypothetical protein